MCVENDQEAKAALPDTLRSAHWTYHRSQLIIVRAFKHRSNLWHATGKRAEALAFPQAASFGNNLLLGTTAAAPAGNTPLLQCGALSRLWGLPRDQLWPFLLYHKASTEPFWITQGKCSCLWNRYLHLDPAPQESWGKRHLAGNKWCLGPAAALVLTCSQEVAAAVWSETEWPAAPENWGKRLGSTETKETVMKWGCGSRLQKCHRSGTFVWILCTKLLSVIQQEQPWLILFPAYIASLTDSLLHKVIFLIVSATDDKTKQMGEYNSFIGLWTCSPTETVGDGNAKCSDAKVEGQKATQDHSATSL